MSRVIHHVEVNHGFDGPSQDRVLVTPTRDALLVVLADGAGGISGGADAAQRVVDTVAERAARSMVARSEWAWRMFLSGVDRDLAAGDVGETTAVALTLSDDGVVGAAVGDSGAWWFADDVAAELTKQQPRKPLLGTGEARPAGFSHARGAGRLVVASDGLFRYAHRDALAEAARRGTVAEALDALVALVRLPSGALQDDLALAVIDVPGGDAPWEERLDVAALPRTGESLGAPQKPKR